MRFLKPVLAFAAVCACMLAVTGVAKRRRGSQPGERKPSRRRRAQA
ncbi:MAG: hypothetical protein ACLQDY_04105 [Streptosporangiaceae bacterium]